MNSTIYVRRSASYAYSKIGDPGPKILKTTVLGDLQGGDHCRTNLEKSLENRQVKQIPKSIVNSANQVMYSHASSLSLFVC